MSLIVHSWVERRRSWQQGAQSFQRRDGLQCAAEEGLDGKHGLPWVAGVQQDRVPGLADPGVFPINSSCFSRPRVGEGVAAATCAPARPLLRAVVLCA